MANQRRNLVCLGGHRREPKRLPRRNDGGDSSAIHGDRTELQQRLQQAHTIPITLGIFAERFD